MRLHAFSLHRLPSCRDIEDKIVETVELKHKWTESQASIPKATRLRRINRALLNRDLIQFNSI